MTLKIGGTLGDAATGHAIEHGSHGGMLATVLSAIALLFSGVSYYESSLRAPELTVFVPPMIHYARDGDSDVFNIPITITNDGAKSGTVLNMELLAENLRPGAERKTARFHSAFVGEWNSKDDAINRSFAPISIGGNQTFSETVRFYPMDNPLPFLVDDKGDFRFTLKLYTAERQGDGFLARIMGSKTEPLTFDLTLPFISFQHLAFRRGTIAMFNKDWQPAVSVNGTDSARSPEPAPETKPAPETPAPAPESK